MPRPYSEFMTDMAEPWQGSQNGWNEGRKGEDEKGSQRFNGEIPGRLLSED